MAVPVVATAPSQILDYRPAPLPGARSALSLLLLINLFNYVDRQVLSAVEQPIREYFGLAKEQTGWLATAFLVSYMVFSPLFGWLGDRTSRWMLVAVGVIVWSLASGGTGLAATFALLLITRCFVGVGEAAYGPVAPTILSDLYPLAIRGRILSWFYLAIPVGSALGYVVGGQLVKLAGGPQNREAWRWPFYAVVLPGIVLGVWALFMRDPRDRATASTPFPATDAPPPPAKQTRLADYLSLLRIPSYVLDCAGMTAMTFAIGGIGFWMPTYLYEHRLRKEVDLSTINLIFGGITVVAGFVATLAGGIAGDALRKRFSGSYFLVSAAGLLTGFPMLLGVLHAPFPYAWVFLFLAVFCLFFNTGPSNTILANVTPPGIRATAFALNIFVIHALGDAISPPVIGWISDRWGMNVAFTFVGVTLLLGGLIWLWGARYLQRDTAAVESAN
jgi:MFS transporter, Spinster family, sphingosine-1-phosphate transporter